MKFFYGKNNYSSLEEGRRHTYLLTNGLGGYSSSTIINSLTRNDHGLFIASITAPNNRINIVSKVDEFLIIDNKKIALSSQEYSDLSKNLHGYVNLTSFSQEYLPEWTYFYDGVKIKKTIVYEHSKDTLGVKYTIYNSTSKEVKLEVIPVFMFNPKGEILSSPHKYTVNGDLVSCNSHTLNIYSNYTETTKVNQKFIDDYFFYEDSKDGRSSIGGGTTLFSYFYNCEGNKAEEYHLIFSLEKNTPSNIDELIKNEISRQKRIIKKSGFKDEISKTLVRASDQFISKRSSTNSKTIIAGYSFFGDWGRDTMFALLGGCIATKRFNETKEIFRTFIKYLDKGLMPNLFPEGENEPLYNTVDASLLFIYALYEYYLASGDLEFIKNKGYDAILSIVEWYKKGTNFNIYMDEDGLINAGQGYDQVTWMDVRYDDILPTPRHGKPVEINAFWYNALKVIEFFGEKLSRDVSEYSKLSEKVKKSFNEKFWNDSEECLKDVVSGKAYDLQVRPNQIWATMVPFSPVSKEQGKLVVNKVYRELYTPYGLRTLSKYDKEFIGEYGGSHFKRDMSYHQGTVWPFPLGGFYISYLKVNDFSKESKEWVREELEAVEGLLREGCVGQIAEIYDGLNPTESRGCFAQAWSVCEILRVLEIVNRS